MVVGCRVIVAENAECNAVNLSVFMEYLRAHPIRSGEDWRTRGAIRIHLSVTSASDRLAGNIPAGLVAVICNNKKVLNKRTAILDCIIGGLIHIRENQHVLSGIVNGTEAILIDVILRHDAPIRTDHLPNSGGGVHVVDAHHVLGLVLRHNNSIWSTANLFIDLGSGCFPLKPKLSNPQNAFHYNDQTYRVSVIGFEAGPAYGMTCHRMQGQTVDGSLLLGSFGTGSTKKKSSFAAVHKHGEDGWLYVVLSRARTFKSVFLLEPLDPNPSNYPPRTDIMKEMKRLQTSLFTPSRQRLEDILKYGVPPLVSSTASRPQQQSNRSDKDEKQ